MFRICFLTALVCVSAAPLGFLQQEKRDVDNTQATVASADVVSELGATDGEAPADYVAPEVAEDDESEDAEEKVDDESEEGVADEDDSEAPSGPTGGASLLQAEPADVTAGDAPADYAEPKVDDSEDADEEEPVKDEEDAADAQADSFLQIDDVDNTKVADVDGNTNEHGDTDGEAPADYVAPVVAEEDDSEEAEEKVDDDSEEGVADEESEEVSGPTGGAFLQKDVDDSEADDNVEDSADGGAVPEDEENVDAAHDDKEAGTGEDGSIEAGEESFLQVASKGSDDYSDADDEEDESNDSTELNAALKDGTDDIEQGFDLDEDDAAVIADDESEEDVEALESEEEDSADEDQ